MPPLLFSARPAGCAKFSEALRQTFRMDPGAGYEPNRESCREIEAQSDELHC